MSRKAAKRLLPDWDDVLSAAARLQAVLPGAVLVGGTAASLYARHRVSLDADHVVSDLRERFDAVLSQLESVAGWTTARVTRPVQILGSLDGIETGVRQLIRTAPLETETVQAGGRMLAVPTLPEMLRIKAVLILKRNATRDYLDFVALAESIGADASVAAMRSFDALYPQPNGESALMQLVVQLASPMPYDLDAIELAEYKKLDAKWHDWTSVRAVCGGLSQLLFARVVAAAQTSPPGSD